jgi:hypothetical protein
MMFGYAHSGYLMAKMTPSPDVEDDDDGRHAGSNSQKPKARQRLDNFRQQHG